MILDYFPALRSLYAKGAILNAKKSDQSSVIHITLVSEDHLFNVSAGVLLNVADPVLDVVKGLLVGDVVHKHDAHSSSVIIIGKALFFSRYS